MTQAAPMARAARPDGRALLAERALLVARRTALGVLGDPVRADDVGQEVAIIALRRSGSVRDVDKLDAWLHRVAVRHALRLARRDSRRAVAEQRAGVPEVVDDPRLGEALTLLDGLPARQRAALTLRYVHDLTDDDIARALGCRASTVRSLLTRGRAAVQSRLDGGTAESLTQEDRDDR